jgi:hypothetical protein
MRRRDFIVGGVAAGVARSFLGQDRPNQDKLNRLSVMTYCFNDIVKDAGKPGDPARTLDILDAPQMIADRYGIHNVEFQHTHFASTDKAYLKEVRERLKKANSRMTQICLEFGSLNISAPQHYVRLETIDLTKNWIDYAAALGCPRVLVNQGSLAPEFVESATATVKVIGEYGKSRKVFVGLENRGGGRRPEAAGAAGPAGGAAAAAAVPVRANPNATAGWEVLVDVIKKGGVYANPDIGNFPDNTARAAGLRAMYPLTSGNSHAHYAPERYSELEAITISKEAGYKGLYSIETGRNNGPDPYAAVQSVLDALLKIV